MTLKLEEIEKLDGERTQGEWVLVEVCNGDNEIVCNKSALISDTEFYPVAPCFDDIKFIAAAPTITSQYSAPGSLR